MATKEETTLPVLLAFRKEINRKKDARGPQKTVQGNVILYVSERTVNFFNIPVYSGEIPLVNHVRGFKRTERDKTTTVVNEYSRSKKTVNSYFRQVKIIYKIDYYLMNFPCLFSLSMIRDALYLLLQKNKEKRRFIVYPSQKKRDIFVGNTPDVWIPKNGQLVEAINIDDAKFAEVTIVQKPALKKRKKLKKP